MKPFEEPRLMLALVLEVWNEMQSKLIEKKEAEVEPLRVLLLLMQRKPSEKKATEEEW